jgi:hypothetical protein
MNQFIDSEKTTEMVWQSPTFQTIPISFEASSYAFTEDDDPIYR